MVRNPDGGCMRAMRGAESIVYEQAITQFCELLREAVIVLFFFFMKAKILEQQHVAIHQGIRFGFSVWPNTIISKCHRLSEES